MRVDWERRTEPDELPEWMDEPCSEQDLRACLRDLGHVNRLSFGYRPTLSFLDRVVAARQHPLQLRILDVGSGGGDLLHQVARWSQRRGVPVRLTGIDLNPFATRAAKDRYGEADFHWLTGDALSFEGEADIIVSSLLTHHLATGEVVRFLRWMESIATEGWFINDLERSIQSASLFALLARVMHWHPFLGHDGPISFARSFVRSDWERMLAQGGIPAGGAEVKRCFPSRLCVGRVK